MAEGGSASLPAPRIRAPSGRAGPAPAGGNLRAWSLGVRLPRRRFGDDSRGALLILTGVLLVLGFVIIGTTLVQLNASEDKTVRAQRDPLMETVDGLVRGFDDAIRTGVDLGDTNITTFLTFTEGAEARLRDSATRTGLYAEVQLYEHPTLQSYLLDGRCGGFDSLRSEQGVIIGYEKDTMTETIVGAVYLINFTDGRQTFRMDYYVEVYECLDRDITTFPESISVTNGTLIGFDALKTDEDAGASVMLKEELTGTDLETATLSLEGLSSSGWTSASGVLADGGTFATHPTGGAADFLDVNAFLSKDLRGMVFTNISVRVDAYHILGINNDDYLTLKARYGGVTFETFTFPALNLVETTYTFYPSLSPSGNSHWTYDEVNNTTWRLEVIEVGLKDSSHFFNVDFMSPTVVYETPLRHIMDIEFDWPTIPSVYGDHVLEMRYQYDPPDGVELQMQVYDYVAGAWEDTGVAIAVTGGSFADWSFTLAEEHFEDDRPRLRLVDLVEDDDDTSQMDIIEIDLLRMSSTFQG